VAQRVLQQVGERALELRRVGVDQRQVVVEHEPDPLRARADGLDGSADHLLDRGPVAPRRRRPGLEARQVEQLLHQAREPGALADDRGGQLAAVVGGEARRAERLGRRDHRRQRRAQVVRDGAQDRRLELVRAPQRGRLDHLPGERLAVERRRQQGLQRGNDPLPQGLERRGGRVARDEQRADRLRAALQR
jgi:hypothetical protein